MHRNIPIMYLSLIHISLGAGQLLAGGDLHVLIGNNAVQLGIGFHHRLLHQHAVPVSYTHLVIMESNRV